MSIFAIAIIVSVILTFSTLVIDTIPKENVFLQALVIIMYCLSALGWILTFVFKLWGV